MNRLAIATACGLGLAILAVALYAWHSMADTALDTNGVVALTLGIVATLALGAMLVGLMLYSNRRGYDDRISQGPGEADPPSPDPPP
jgi:peptidoglycan/LPS O-acetylase OafA/YrhL